MDQHPTMPDRRRQPEEGNSVASVVDVGLVTHTSFEKMTALKLLRQAKYPLVWRL